MIVKRMGKLRLGSGITDWRRRVLFFRGRATKTLRGMQRVRAMALRAQLSPNCCKIKK